MFLFCGLEFGVYVWRLAVSFCFLLGWVGTGLAWLVLFCDCSAFGVGIRHKLCDFGVLWLALLIVLIGLWVWVFVFWVRLLFALLWRWFVGGFVCEIVFACVSYWFLGFDVFVGNCFGWYWRTCAFGVGFCGVLTCLFILWWFWIFWVLVGWCSLDALRGKDVLGLIDWLLCYFMLFLVCGLFCGVYCLLGLMGLWLVWLGWFDLCCDYVCFDWYKRKLVVFVGLGVRLFDNGCCFCL